MTPDYERHAMTRHPSRFPHVDRTWTIGTVLAALGSLVSVAAVMCGLIWGYASVTYAAQRIPEIQKQQDTNRLDIAVLKNQQETNAAQYGEILRQFANVNNKLDQLQQQKADKTTREWQR